MNPFDVIMAIVSKQINEGPMSDNFSKLYLPAFLSLILIIPAIADPASDAEVEQRVRVGTFVNNNKSLSAVLENTAANSTVQSESELYRNTAAFIRTDVEMIENLETKRQLAEQDRIFWKSSAENWMKSYCDLNKKLEESKALVEKLTMDNKIMRVLLVDAYETNAKHSTPSNVRKKVSTAAGRKTATLITAH